MFETIQIKCNNTDVLPIRYLSLILSCTMYSSVQDSFIKQQFCGGACFRLQPGVRGSSHSRVLSQDSVLALSELPITERLRGYCSS